MIYLLGLLVLILTFIYFSFIKIKLLTYVQCMCSKVRVSGSHQTLVRTSSDNRMVSPDSKPKKSPQHKNSVTKAWLQFQADIEAALFRKPSNNGMYKNLSDMLQNRMDQLEQVIIGLVFSLQN